MHNPYAELIGLRFESSDEGRSLCTLPVTGQLLNPHGVLHGGAVYAMADTGMGAALYTTLEPGEICATIEIKINYFRPVTDGELQCDASLVYRGRSVANLDAAVYAENRLVAKANGSFAIFRARQER